LPAGKAMMAGPVMDIEKTRRRKKGHNPDLYRRLPQNLSQRKRNVIFGWIHKAMGGEWNR
jgi:hypothetical protein